MPVGNSRHSATSGSQPETGTECLVIEYAPANSGEEAPKLYVPVTEAHLVSKYVGGGQGAPAPQYARRHALAQGEGADGTRRPRCRLRTCCASRPCAKRRPATRFRRTQTGSANSKAPSFTKKTADQVTAIAETKSDMERAKPMDRLICGDVGFGKTEVAIRAAFKAVMGGKQVAILVPTTVLAQQHFNTFRERMADYPIRVELLSRYRTPREQDFVVKNLAAGTVDIVIGTHRDCAG